MNPFKWLVNKLYNRSADPVYECEVYFHKGCSHVDGYLCNMDTCDIREDYADKVREENND